jgi:hypothetical protein
LKRTNRTGSRPAFFSAAPTVVFGYFISLAICCSVRTISASRVRSLPSAIFSRMFAGLPAFFGSASMSAFTNPCSLAITSAGTSATVA